MAVRIRNHVSITGLVYVTVGIVVAVAYDYITAGLLARLASALLAIVLWPLPLLGIDLNIG
jgi:hypothetical protein